jgi:N-acetylmuramoyl-L-alanine amidase
MNRSQLIKRLTNLKIDVSNEIDLIEFELKNIKDIDGDIINDKPIVLLVGHSAESGGAMNDIYNINEYEFNNDLVKQISKLLELMDFKRKIIIEKRRNYIGLPRQINNHNPLFVISLHANAFNEKATGTEMLYYHLDDLSMQLAVILQKNITKALGLKSRGIKAKGENDRGGYLLKKVKCPIVIAEPFFIDNTSDYSIAKKNYNALIRAYANSIVEFDYLMEN